MSGFSPVSLAAEPPDPTKHVNYVPGMVLDAPAFRQDFAYLSWRDEWIARDLVGHGVVRGLRVHVEAGGAAGPEVVVEPGIAITPTGSVARIEIAQCAPLNEWLQRSRRIIAGRLPSVPVPGDSFEITAFVVLSYEARETDAVPIPPDVCGDGSESIAFSRLSDGFVLDVALEPPEDVGDLGRRRIAEYLRGVPVVESGGSTLADLLAPLRTARIEAPISTAGLSVRRGDLRSFYDEALAVYAREVRARWLFSGEDVALRPPAEKRLLLAEARIRVEVQADESWRVLLPLASDATMSPPRTLVETDLLRELLLDLAGAARTPASATPSGSTTLVAAGVLKVVPSTASPSGPTTGRNLRAHATGPGQVTLRHDVIAAPGGASPVYVLHCVAQGNGAIAVPVVAITSQAPGEFVLAVRDAAAVTPASVPPETDVAGLVLHVEITAFTPAP